MGQIRAGLAAMALIASGSASAAFETSASPPDFEHTVFGFAGAMTDANMHDSAAFFATDYEDNAVIGGGYQFFPYTLGNTRLGFEAGLAGRLGDKATLEVWGGVAARYDSIRLGDHLFLSPAFSVGISHVSATQPGREQRQEDADQGDASTLFYLGPEINVSFQENSDFEIFWRLHHRSGAGGTLGDMRGAANANVLGIRYKF